MNCGVSVVGCRGKPGFDVVSFAPLIAGSCANYSITSVAPTSRAWGTASPNAFAALKLITKSNLEGTWPLRATNSTRSRRRGDRMKLVTSAAGTFRTWRRIRSLSAPGGCRLALATSGFDPERPRTTRVSARPIRRTPTGNP